MGGREFIEWRCRNQTQLQRLKPLPKNPVTAGLKPGPPKSVKILRGASGTVSG